MATVACVFRCRNARCGEEWVVAEAPEVEPWWLRCPACGHETERGEPRVVPWDTHYFLEKSGKMRTWYGTAKGNMADDRERG